MSTHWQSMPQAVDWYHLDVVDASAPATWPAPALQHAEWPPVEQCPASNGAQLLMGRACRRKPCKAASDAAHMHGAHMVRIPNVRAHVARNVWPRGCSAATSTGTHRAKTTIFSWSIGRRRGGYRSVSSLAAASAARLAAAVRTTPQPAIRQLPHRSLAALRARPGPDRVRAARRS